MAARITGDAHAAVDRALYEEHRLVRMLGMRRTVFVVPVDLAPIVQGACSDAIARGERRKLGQYLETAGFSAADAWLEALGTRTVADLERRGEATAAELSADVPELRMQVPFAIGKSYEGTFSVGTRLLGVLAAEGRIVRGRPRGSWVSTQYRWVPVDRWIPGGLRRLPAAEAQAELARRYLRAFGPATERDLRWWTGWPAGETRRALAAAAAVEVALEGGTGFLLPDDLDPAPTPEPWAALLPALDPTVMGWAGRAWYLGPHGAALFDRAGNAGPTVWWDGRAVGGWGQRTGGEIVYRLLEDVGADARAAIDGAAARMQDVVGTTRAVPNFRTPLDRELSSLS